MINWTNLYYFTKHKILNSEIIYLFICLKELNIWCILFDWRWLVYIILKFAFGTIACIDTSSFNWRQNKTECSVIRWERTYTFLLIFSLCHTSFYSLWGGYTLPLLVLLIMWFFKMLGLFVDLDWSLYYNVQIM